MTRKSISMIIRPPMICTLKAVLGAPDYAQTSTVVVQYDPSHKRRLPSRELSLQRTSSARIPFLLSVLYPNPDPNAPNSSFEGHLSDSNPRQTVGKWHSPSSALTLLYFLSPNLPRSPRSHLSRTHPWEMTNNNCIWKISAFLALLILTVTKVLSCQAKSTPSTPSCAEAPQTIFKPSSPVFQRLAPPQINRRTVANPIPHSSKQIAY